MLKLVTVLIPLLVLTGCSSLPTCPQPTGVCRHTSAQHFADYKAPASRNYITNPIVYKPTQVRSSSLRGNLGTSNNDGTTNYMINTPKGMVIGTCKNLNNGYHYCY